MMANYFKPFVILLAFFMQSCTDSAHTTEIYPIYFKYEGTPKLDGNPKPSRSRTSCKLPLEVYLYVNSKILLFKNANMGHFSYYIYDSQNNLEIQGEIISSMYTLNLDPLIPYKQYTIIILYNNRKYKSSIEL